VPHATQVSLCVAVARAQASSERGHSAQWTVSAWTTGGNVPDATIRLQATPASGGAPGFSFGCGNADGTSSCDLGAVDAKSAPRQLQAQLTVPVTASSVTSVSLTVTGSAAHLAKDPAAAATVSITAPPPPTTPSQNPSGPQNPGAPQNAGAPQNPSAPQNPATPQSLTQPLNPAALPPVPTTVSSPLPVGSLPGIPNVGPTLGPNGNAANLFPTLDPKPSSTGLAQSNHNARTRPVANTSALPAGAPVVGAQLAGLAALALAFVLAVTRLTIRRRPTPTKATPDAAAAPTPPTETKEPPAEEPAERQKATENPPADPPAASGDVKPDA